MSNQAAADSLSRKRSRSPEETDDDKYASQPNSKRQNTGLASSGSSGAFDVAMSESQDIKPVIPPPQATHASSVELVDKPKDLPPKPEPATAAAADQDGQKTAAGSNSTTPAAHLIHMRCLIVTQDASIIIGKGGAHVNEIREKSGAKVMVSESIPGNPERILNVSGALDAVSKVCI
jgi:heterogeneous nuclear rnp K-like protein